MNQTIWIAIVTYIAYGAMSIVAIHPLREENKRHFNPVARKFIYLVVILFLVNLGRFTVMGYSEYIIEGPEPTIGPFMTFSEILALTAQAIEIFFLLSIFDVKKHLPFPWMQAFWIGVQIFETGNLMWYLIATVFTAFLVAGFFLVNGIRHREGRNLAFGINMILVTLPELVVPLLGLEFFYTGIGYLVGTTVLALGTWGVLDRHLLVDRKKEAAIRQTWAAQMITRDKSGGIPNIWQESKRILVKCPKCGRDNVISINAESVEARKKDKRGVVLHEVQDFPGCHHDFGVYVDRDFKVLGYLKAFDVAVTATNQEK